MMKLILWIGYKPDTVLMPVHSRYWYFTALIPSLKVKVSSESRTFHKNRAME